MSRHIDFIDGLRGLAILGVIYHHLFYSSTSPGFRSIQVAGIEIYPYALLSNGWLGVNLFFFLSGFVLYWPYLTRTRSMQGWSGTSLFYSRRASRLLPLFYINILICACLVFWAYGAPGFVEKLLLLGSFTFVFTLDEFTPTFNWVLWSLGLEVWFSVLFPLIVLAIFRFGHKTVFIATVAISLAIRIYGMDESFQMNNNPYLNPVKDSLFGRLDDFLFGMMACYCCVENKFNYVRPENSGRYILLGLLLVFAVCMLWDGAVLSKINPAYIPFFNMLFNAGVFLIVLGAYRSRGFFRQALENWPLMVTGMMCYSLYVWHGVLMASMLRGSLTVSGIATYLIILFLLCGFSYRYIEFGHVKSARELFRLRRTG